MNKGIVVGAVLALAGFGAGTYFARQDQPPPAAIAGSAGPSYTGGFRAEGESAEAVKAGVASGNIKAVAGPAGDAVIVV